MDEGILHLTPPTLRIQELKTHLMNAVAQEFKTIPRCPGSRAGIRPQFSPRLEVVGFNLGVEIFGAGL